MALKFNGTTVKSVKFNGTALKKIVYNAVTVWTSATYYLSTNEKINNLKSWNKTTVTGAITVNSYNITMTNNGENATKNLNVGVCTNGISVTGVSKLYIVYTASATSIHSASKIGITTSTSDYSDYTSYTKSSTITTGTKTITIDVSSLSGTYYLKMNLFAKDATVKVTEVYCE